jgi:hypothetical protein
MKKFVEVAIKSIANDEAQEAANRENDVFGIYSDWSDRDYMNARIGQAERAIESVRAAYKADYITLDEADEIYSFFANLREYAEFLPRTSLIESVCKKWA